MSENKRELTCIVCPEGCSILAEISENGIKTEGNKCPRGAAYAIQEIEDPRRNIASSVAVIGGVRPIVSVKTSCPIPKDKIFEVMGEIREVTVPAPVNAGQVIIKNTAGTGADIIATASVETK